MTQENNETLAFVLACLFSNSISLDEFHQWVERFIGQTPTEEIPLYFFDLINFNDSLAKIYHVIGYMPHWEHADKHEAVLYAITSQRGRALYDDDALSSAQIAFTKSPEIIELFRKTFPFVSIS